MKRITLAAAVLLAATTAWATPQHKLATGLWVKPDESGWGVNLFHQGNTVFGSLFVYGPDGQPRWYVAPAMVNGDDGPIHDHPTGVAGDLYEATGPYFAGPFDPTKVTMRKVGSMSIDLGSNLTGIIFTIDGVTVSKNNVTPFTWRPDNLTGDYLGFEWQPPASPFTSGPEVRKEVSIHIADSGSAITMSTTSSNNSCTYSAAHSQNRDFVGGSGTYSCSNGTSGNFSLGVDITPDGFMGSFGGDSVGGFWGRLGGSWTRNVIDGGTGVNNDLWFPPNEAGWGVNFLEQGDTGFATLFVYDPQGKSHWYSASDLHRVGPNENDYWDYVGSLYESTGPYFGTSFNPSAVSRREVGTLVFEPHGDGTARVTYKVDGVSVDKIVNRFALAKNSLSGTYIGHIVAIAPAATPEAVTMTIDDGASQVVINTTSSRGACTYTSPVIQTGELRQLSGNFTCSDGRSGAFRMHNVILQWSGFVGSFDATGINSGKIEGVRAQMN